MREKYEELGLDPNDPDHAELAPHGMSGDETDDEEVEAPGSIIEDYMDDDDEGDSDSEDEDNDRDSD